MFTLRVLSLVLAVGFVVFVPLTIGVMVIRSIARGGGGWGKLASRFATLGPAPAGWRHGVTASVGKVTHKRCLGLAVTEEGLDIRYELPVLRRLFPPLLVPWEEFRRAEPARLHGRAAMRLEVGEPVLGTVTIAREVFEAIQRERGRFARVHA